MRNGMTPEDQTKADQAQAVHDEAARRAEALVPDHLCEPVFIINGEPRGHHLSLALELEVPVVILTTAEGASGSAMDTLLAPLLLPQHPAVTSQYVGHPSLLPHFKKLWRDHVKKEKLEKAMQRQCGESAGNKRGAEGGAPSSGEAADDDLPF